MKDIAPSSLKSPSSRETSIPLSTFADTYARIGGNTGLADMSERNWKIKEKFDFELQPCSEEDIAKIIAKIPVNKATGIDGLPMKAIKHGLKSLLSPITMLVNKLLVLGFPAELKRAVVLPIYKKGSRDDANNYRPISVLPGISKIAERVVSHQLNNYLQGNGLMADAQHGFRQQHY